jgi:AGCS family alanine or glycine:cation symporter
MILCSGTYNILGPDGQLLYAGAPELGNNYVNFTQSAVDSVFAGFGSKFISVAMVFFVYSTVMAYYFYAETSLIYLFNGKKGEKLSIRILQALMLCAVVFGAIKEADVVWQLGDIGVGMMAWVTVISILILCPQAIRSLRDYEKKLER